MNNIDLITIKDICQLEQILKDNKGNIKTNTLKAFCIGKSNKQSEILKKISEMISIAPDDDAFGDGFDFYSTSKEGYSIEKIYIFNELQLVLIQTHNE
jgi:hypothetical protein